MANIGGKFLPTGPQVRPSCTNHHQISGELSPKWRPTPQKATSESLGGLQAPIFIDFRFLETKFPSILDPSRPPAFKSFHHRFLWLSRLFFILTYHCCHHFCLRPCFTGHLKAKGPAAEALAVRSAGPLVGHERAKSRLRSSNSNSRASASAAGPS